MITLTDHHIPIISRDLWNTVQQELQQRSKHTSQSRSVHYALSGKIKCGVCGATFVARRRKLPDGRVSLRWSCATSVRGGCKIARILRDDDARQMFRQALCALELNPSSLRTSITHLLHGDSPNREQVEREQLRILDRKTVLLDAYASGHITKEELALMKETYDRKLTSLEQRLQAPSSGTIPGEAVEHILQHPEASDALCKLLVECITVCPQRIVELKLSHLPMKFRFRDGTPLASG